MTLSSPHSHAQPPTRMHIHILTCTPTGTHTHIHANTRVCLHTPKHPLTSTPTPPTATHSERCGFSEFSLVSNTFVKKAQTKKSIFFARN